MAATIVISILFIFVSAGKTKFLIPVLIEEKVPKPHFLNDLEFCDFSIAVDPEWRWRQLYCAICSKTYAGRKPEIDNRKVSDTQNCLKLEQNMVKVDTDSRIEQDIKNGTKLNATNPDTAHNQEQLNRDVESSPDVCSGEVCDNNETIISNEKIRCGAKFENHKLTPIDPKTGECRTPNPKPNSLMDRLSNWYSSKEKKLRRKYHEKLSTPEMSPKSERMGSPNSKKTLNNKYFTRINFNEQNGLSDYEDGDTLYGQCETRTQNGMIGVSSDIIYSRHQSILHSPELSEATQSVSSSEESDCSLTGSEREQNNCEGTKSVRKLIDRRGHISPETIEKSHSSHSSSNGKPVWTVFDKLIQKPMQNEANEAFV